MCVDLSIKAFSKPSTHPRHEFDNQVLDGFSCRDSSSVCHSIEQ